MIGITRGYGVVLRHQAECYEWIKKLYDPSDIYMLSEEKLRDEISASGDYLKYIGNMSPIQVIVLDKDNINKFITTDMGKFDIIIEQGEHYPLSLLINKYAKKHGVITLDVHQGADYLEGYFNVPLKKRIISYVYLFFKLRFRGFRHLIYVLLKNDIMLFFLFVMNYNHCGYRLFPSLPKEYRFDKCFVYGNKYKTYYKMMGYKEDDIVIHGDRDLTEYERYDGETYLSDKPYVVYVDSKVAQLFSFSNELNKLAKGLTKKGYNVFFYPHPNLTNDFYSLLNDNFTILPKRSINKYLKNADFILTHNSNLVHLLVYADKRFCFLYVSKMIGTYSLKLQGEMAAGLGVPNIDVEETDNILKLIEEFHFDSKKYEKFLFENCGSRKIHSIGSDNILINSVKELLSQRKTRTKYIDE